VLNALAGIGELLGNARPQLEHERVAVRLPDLTVSQVAKELLIRRENVVAFLKSGVLAGYDVTAPGARRKSYRITREAGRIQSWAIYEAARAGTAHATGCAICGERVFLTTIGGLPV